MAEVFVFQPREESDVDRNLLDFIALVRERTVLGTGPKFDEPEWDVADFFPEETGRSLRFYTYGSAAKRSRTRTAPLAEPFGAFAKAYLAHHHGLNGTTQKGLMRRLVALKALERVSRTDDACWVRTLNGDSFNRALAFLIERGHAKDAVYGIGKCLEEVASFLSENRLVVVPIQWKSYAATPDKLTSGIGEAADEARAKKLPSQAAVEAIPRIFHICASAPKLDTFAAIVTSYCAILMSAPSRASELLQQPIDFLVEGFSENNPGLNMRWWPKKGGTPLPKPVLEPMADVTKRAVAVLMEATAQARALAAWYEKNPGKLYFYPDVEHLRGKAVLSMQEVANILWGPEGLKDCARLFVKRHELKEEPRKNRHCARYVRVSEVERGVQQELPAGFPNYRPHRRYSEMLFVTPGATIRQDKLQSLRVTFAPITQSMILMALGAPAAKESIFSRYGFTEADGSPIKLNTHQFRHWLNTLAQLSGLSQMDIALWSGRKDVGQNAVYNHVTAEQRLEMLRAVVGDSARATGTLGSLPTVIPIARADYVAQKIPTAHVTDFGYCVHDFSMAPCQLHRDCMYCTEQVCVKGDKAAEKRLIDKIEETQRLLDCAREAMANEHYGADRWVQHNQELLVRMQALRDLLDDPDVAPGTIIQMSNPDAPSRLKLALENRVRLPQTYPYGKPKDAEENATRIAQRARAQPQ